MQLMLILGIAFAIASVSFALQNNVPVTVNFIVWSFQSSLAMVLLLALGIGALIAALMSSPTVIRGQWVGKRLHRQVRGLEAEKAALERRVLALGKQFEEIRHPVPELPKPHVSLTTLLGSTQENRDGRG